MNDADKILVMADNQPITRLGVWTLWSKMVPDGCVITVFNKSELQNTLNRYPASLVLLDYTLFDFSDLESLLITGSRFKHVHWILFSEDLNESFLRCIIPKKQYSIVMKNTPLEEIKNAIKAGLSKKQYICNGISTILNYKKEYVEKMILSTTELQILKGIAEGKTSRQLAEERCLSIHTIATHRKNIFRKISVNNVLEASKYAVRIGLVNLTEYYI